MPELYPEHNYQDSPERDEMHDDEPACAVCGNSRSWVECFECGGEGYVDETDIDPLEGDEFAPCAMCGTRGGWYECDLSKQHFTEKQKAKRDAVDTAGQVTKL